MKIQLKTKTAIITGAGGGIGRAVAVKLARSGMNIILFGGNNAEKLQTTAAMVEEHSNALIIQGNLTNLEFLSSAIKTAAEKFGGADVLINNAGVAQSTPF